MTAQPSLRTRAQGAPEAPGKIFPFTSSTGKESTLLTLRYSLFQWLGSITPYINLLIAKAGITPRQPVDVCTVAVM